MIKNFVRRIKRSVDAHFDGHLVLLGDSIFDNLPYVPTGSAVINHLNGSLPLTWDTVAANANASNYTPSQYLPTPISLTPLTWPNLPGLNTSLDFISSKNKFIPPNLTPLLDFSSGAPRMKANKILPLFHGFSSTDGDFSDLRFSINEDASFKDIICLAADYVEWLVKGATSQCNAGLTNPCERDTRDSTDHQSKSMDENWETTFRKFPVAGTVAERIINYAEELK